MKKQKKSVKNKSFYFSELWGVFCGNEQNIYYQTYGFLSTVFNAFRTAELCFTLVDHDYSPLDSINHDPSYRTFVVVQDCPVFLENTLLNKGFTKRPWGTFVVDLQQSEDELWNNLSKSAKKLVRRTRKHCNVEIVETEEQLREYHTMIIESRSKLGLKHQSYHQLRDQWKLLSPDLQTIFLIRSNDGVALAGMGLLHSEYYMKEISAAQRLIAREKNIYANDLLKWELILWGKKQGIRYYDLAGVHPDPEPGSKHEGIRRFKEKWGGVYHRQDFFERTETNNFLFKFLFLIERFVTSIRRTE